jgi:hypothetical protein
MTPRPPGDRYRLWPAAWPYIRVLALSPLPVPDLATRRKVRRTARSLVKCDPWPGMEATGGDAAQLALVRLLALQKDIHKAVRTRQDEAATMLARMAIETLITGLYCIHEPTAVTRLQSDQMRQLTPMLEFMMAAGLLSKDVLAECIQRLDLGEPVKGPDVASMARLVDTATGGPAATDLYNRFYRPTSNLALHAGAASLLRHVRSDGSLARRPSRVWGRRSPARIADTCLGFLTAALAYRAGVPWQRAVKYGDRHHGRVLPPVVTISLAGFARGIRPGHALMAINRIRKFGEYVRSGQDAADPAVRTARIRAEMEALLTTPGLDIPVSALDPYLDYVATMIASANQAAPC